MVDDEAAMKQKWSVRELVKATIVNKKARLRYIRAGGNLKNASLIERLIPLQEEMELKLLQLRRRLTIEIGEVFLHPTVSK